MPKVGNKVFAYNKQGIADAKAESRATGQKIVARKTYQETAHESAAKAKQAHTAAATKAGAPVVVGLEGGRNESAAAPNAAAKSNVKNTVTDAKSGQPAPVAPRHGGPGAGKPLGGAVSMIRPPEASESAKEESGESAATEAGEGKETRNDIIKRVFKKAGK